MPTVWHVNPPISTAKFVEWVNTTVAQVSGILVGLDPHSKKRFDIVLGFEDQWTGVIVSSTGDEIIGFTRTAPKIFQIVEAEFSVQLVDEHDIEP